MFPGSLLCSYCLFPLNRNVVLGQVVAGPVKCIVCSEKMFRLEKQLLQNSATHMMFIAYDVLDQSVEVLSLLHSCHHWQSGP